MIRGAMRVPNLARYLAPLALAAVAAGTYEIIHTGLQTSHPAAASVTIVHGRRLAHRKPPKATKFYIVHPNDTLSGIAVKTGVSLAQLESLNPRLSPDSLSTGQRLKLRR
jgi:LysM repeat protein